MREADVSPQGRGFHIAYLQIHPFDLLVISTFR